MSSHITLPVVTVQRDFNDVVQEVYSGITPTNKFWVSCYKSGEPSVHTNVNVDLDEVDRNLLAFRSRDGQNAVEFCMKHKACSVACASLGIPPTDVVLPVQDYYDPERTTTIRPQRVTAFDVSPDLSRFATGHMDGSVFVYPTSPLSPPSTPLPSLSIQNINTSKTKILSKPHSSYISSLQFFPSSRVILTSAADFSLSILSADLPPPASSQPAGSTTTSSNPTFGTRILPTRTLRAHTRSVTSACIIGIGRNVLSASLDATLRLWDVPNATVLHTYHASSPVLSVTLGERVPNPPDGDMDVVDGESKSSETAINPDSVVPEVMNSVVYAGLANGGFEAHDLRAGTCVYRSPAGSSASGINALAYLPTQSLLATGSADGVVSLYDVRSLGAIVTSFKRNDAAISDLAFVSSLPSSLEDAPAAGPMTDVGLAVATMDGLPYLAGVMPEGPGVIRELIGVDCDPVRSIRVRKNEVWVVSDDSVVRRYLV